MNITILECIRPGEQKDFNGGYGTSFNPGQNLGARTLKYLRARLEYLPVLSYAYLSSILKEKNHQVEYINNSIDFKADIVFHKPSLINYNRERELLKLVKSKQSVKVILFGPLVNAFPNLFLEVADIVLVGDIENLFKLYDSLNDIETGIVEIGRLDNLDDLPFPDWSLYDYLAFKQYPLFKRGPTLMIQGSRSCPYKCVYCPYIANNQKYLARSTANVISEIKHNQIKYGVNSFLFRDPVFGLNRKWVKQLCEEIIKEGMDVEWGCETRFDLLDEELILLMIKSGFCLLKVGVESYDHVQLKYLERVPPSIEHQERIVNFLMEKKVKVSAFYVLGLPDDTEASILKTIKYSQKLNTAFSNFTICTPLPGTKLYDDLKSDIVVKDFEYYNNYNLVYKHKVFSAHKLQSFQSKAFTSYYFRISYWIANLKILLS